MLKRLTALIMCLAVLTVTSAVFAEDVYITERGKKYHKQDCRFVVNRDTQNVSLKEAESKGLSPCGRCFGNTEKITKQTTQVDEIKGMVYATKNGKKYHKPGCQLVKNKNATGIPIEEAEDKGLTPCGRCFSQQQAKAE